jgi:hypothetical protein
MIYTAPCNAFDAAGVRGLGPGNLDFFGPQMAFACWLDATSHFTGSKKVSISRAQPPPICPRNGCCPHQKHYTRGRINLRCINSYYDVFCKCAEIFLTRCIYISAVEKYWYKVVTTVRGQILLQYVYTVIFCHCCKLEGRIRYKYQIWTPDLSLLRSYKEPKINCLPEA